MIEEELLNINVGDINKLIVKNPAIVKENCTIREMLEKVIEDTRSRHAYIVDEDDHLIGSIRMNQIIQYLFPTTILLEDRDSPRLCSFLDYSEASKVSEIMNRNPIYVFEKTSLPEMIKIMHQETVNELPVVDKNLRVVGEVNVLQIIAFSLKS